MKRELKCLWNRDDVLVVLNVTGIQLGAVSSRLNMWLNKARDFMEVCYFYRKPACFLGVASIIRKVLDT